MSALFALKLEERGIANAQVLVTLTFLLIIGTVVIQSASPRAPLLLFAVNERGHLRFETEHMALQPKAGWTACVLAPPDSKASV